MKSHTCDFSVRLLAPLVAWPLLPPAVFALVMHLGATTSLLPPPRPTLDTEHTVLIHQADAAQSPQNAGIILLGDSSCLMDVSALQLSEQLGRPALNLGTFSFLDVNAHADMLRHYVQANPGRLHTVVLLMHAESLRRLGAESYYVDALNRFWAGEDDPPSDTWTGHFNHALGVNIFKGRLLARALPLPLGGTYGRRYGFTRDLERHLAVHLGSAVDPDRQPLTGTAEYRLAATLEKASRNFRAAVPPGVQLLAGITPAPERFAGRGYPALQRTLLAQWAEWLGATPLTNLPATLDDTSFVRTTHLNETAVAGYTAALSQELRSTANSR